LINLATLTGAVKVALGPTTAGVFGNCEKLENDIKKSGDKVFESFWRLPILDEHRDAMKGKFSDLNNKGNTPYGGASQAAAFLERFIDKDVSWAHLDIAGPAMTKAAKPPVNLDGTGFGTQTLLQYVCNVHKSE
jgi:leucyl aminopeptidase